MKKLLVINSSARTLRSYSRMLTEVFVEHWQRAHANAPITFRDLGNMQVPHINEQWIEAAFKPESSRSVDERDSLRISDAYISELREADIIVLGSPMYNWSIPSTLKAYIDQILRVNETWKINPADPVNPYIGLLENKTLVLLLARGAQDYERGGYNEQMNFQSTYLRTVFTIIGIDAIHVVAINGVSSNRENLRQSIDESHKQVQELIHHL